MIFKIVGFRIQSFIKQNSDNHKPFPFYFFGSIIIVNRIAKCSEFELKNQTICWVSAYGEKFLYESGKIRIPDTF